MLKRSAEREVLKDKVREDEELGLKEERKKVCGVGSDTFCWWFRRVKNFKKELNCVDCK